MLEINLLFMHCSISLHVWYSELLLLPFELKNHLSSKMRLLNWPSGWKGTLYLSEMILSREKQNTEAREKTHSPPLPFEPKYSQE